jgi:hypothetical protein
MAARVEAAGDQVADGVVDAGVVQPVRDVKPLQQQVQRGALADPGPYCASRTPKALAAALAPFLPRGVCSTA